MVLEIMQLTVRPGTQEQLTQGWDSFSRAVTTEDYGIQTLRLVQEINADNRFALLIEWVDAAAHARFAQTDTFDSFRSVVEASTAQLPTFGDYV